MTEVACSAGSSTPTRDSVVQAVVAQFQNRSEVGIAKYGTTLDRTDLTTLQWLQHTQEELMDAVLYIERVKRDLKNKAE